MPRIPSFTANPQVQTPRLSPGAMAAPSEALARAGENLQQFASDTNNAFARAAQKERELIRKIKAADIEANVEDGYSKAAFGLQSLGVDDHDKYNESMISEINNNALGMAKDDPELSAMVQPYLSRKRADFLNVSRGSLYKKLGEKAEAHIERMNIQALDLYAEAQTPEERAMIRNNFAIGVEGFANDGLVDPKVPIVLLENFDNLAESVRAERAIENDPYAAKKLIESGEFNLNAKIKQDMIGKAESEIKHKEVEARIARNEAKQAAREAEDNAKKADMNTLFSFYENQDWSSAAKVVHDSQGLDGMEKIRLLKEIESASAEKDPFKKSDPKHVDQLFKDASAGLVAPEEIRPIPGKVSREDYRLAQGLAQMALKPEKQYMTDLLASVRKEAKERILGSAYMYTGTDEGALKRAGEADRFILQKFFEAATDEERIGLLDQNSKSFVLPQALQGKQTIDTRRDGQPDYSGMWSK